MDPTVKAIRKAARSKPPIRHSAVYRWLRDRHAELAVVMRENGPGWELVRGKMAEQGLTNRNGSPLTVCSVRKTWAVVCRHIRDGAGFPDGPKPQRRRPNRSPRKGSIETIRAPGVGEAEASGAPTPFAPPRATPMAPSKLEMTPQEARDAFRRSLENRSRPIRPRSAP